MKRPDARENCVNFIASVLGDKVDANILKQLDRRQDLVTRNDASIEITPETGEDAYGRRARQDRSHSDERRFVGLGHQSHRGVQQVASSALTSIARAALSPRDGLICDSTITEATTDGSSVTRTPRYGRATEASTMSAMIGTPTVVTA